MKKIVFVTPADTSSGFGLAGVRHLATMGDEPARMVAALAADPSTGVLAVDERLLDAVVQRELDAIDRREPVVAVVLPAPSATETPLQDYALRLIRRAIGYQVRVNL